MIKSKKPFKKEYIDPDVEKWVSFRDKLPKEGKTVLILREVSIGHVKRFTGMHMIWDELRQEYLQIEEYSNWRPFPKPPKKIGNKF